MKNILYRILNLFCLCGLSLHCAYAQYNLPENKVWIFDAHNGIDFNGTPAGISSNMCYSCFASGFEVYPPGASVCNTTGQLLFYTDGSIIWNKNGQKMAHANPSLGALNMAPQSTRGTDGALIVGLPYDTTKYLVFSLTDLEHTYPLPGRLYYSIVDMQLNNGLGDVMTAHRWISVDTGLSQKLTAVPGNDCNIWLIAHARSSNMFKAYEITWKGINPDPVISYSGTTTGAALLGWDYGQFTISPGRTRLAAAYGEFVELHDFDPATGIVSNGWKVDQSAMGGRDITGVCFSPDNSKLYTGHFEYPSFVTLAACDIYQFDLNLPTQAAVAGSVNIIAGMSYLAYQRQATIGELRLGPDGRVYYARSEGTPQAFGAIRFPDLYGPACQANLPQSDIAASADYGGTGRGMGNEFVKAITGAHPDTTILALDTCFSGYNMVLKAPQGNFIAYKWDDGTADSARAITAPGQYWLLCIDRCRNVVRKNFHIKGAPYISLGNDTTVCDVPYRLQVNLSGASLLWQDGSTGTTMNVQRSGTYWVAITAEGCTDTQSIHIRAINVHPDLPPEITACNDKVLVLDPGVGEEGAAYTWQDGTHNALYTVRDSGLYRVTVQKEMCMASDSIYAHLLGCQCSPLVPNAFSPNGDGLNDVFVPQYFNCSGARNLIFQIFNRYGQRIFSAYDPHKGWDGTFEGKACDAGAYFYDLKYDTPAGIAVYRKGDIVLVR